MSEKLEIIKEQEVLGKQFRIYGTFDNPLFLAKDVAEWIEHSDVHKMVQSVDEDEKVRNIIPTLGGSQEMWFLTENGLYEILMLSRKPIAKEFKKEVKKILKEIRKTGSYSVQKMSNEDLMAIVVQTNNQIANICASMNEQLKVTTSQTQENTARIEKLEKQFEQKKVEVAPDLPPKEHIIALVRKHADKTKETDYAKLYRQFYSDYGLRTHTNPTVKAKKSNMTTIAFIEKEGDIKLLLSIAEKLFGFGA